MVSRSNKIDRKKSNRSFPRIVNRSRKKNTSRIKAVKPRKKSKSRGYSNKRGIVLTSRKQRSPRTVEVSYVRKL